MTRAQSILEQLEFAGSVRVSQNPRNVSALASDLKMDVERLYDRTNAGLRVLAHIPKGDIYLWDANLGVHFEMANKLGLNYLECVRGDSTGLDKQTRSTGTSDRGLQLLIQSPGFHQCESRLERAFND